MFDPIRRSTRGNNRVVALQLTCTCGITPVRSSNGTRGSGQPPVTDRLEQQMRRVVITALPAGSGRSSIPRLASQRIPPFASLLGRVDLGFQRVLQSHKTFDDSNEVHVVHEDNVVLTRLC